jgi:hypothetical protein
MWFHTLLEGDANARGVCHHKWIRKKGRKKSFTMKELKDMKGKRRRRIITQRREARKGKRRIF